MRLSVVILPIYPWPQARDIWRRAEELGAHAAYTYDHLTWRSFRDGPWGATVPTLTAASTVTSTMRLGTMVAGPNFRHPVPFAKDVMTLDDVSGGRVVLGLGSGGTGFDSTVLGQAEWSPRERSDRFAEFVELLDALLRQPLTNFSGLYYSASEAQMLPGCVQSPRVPFVVAAAGPRAMRLVAAYGEGWVTYGDPRLPSDASVAQRMDELRAQVTRLEAACADAGRDPATIDRLLLTGTSTIAPLDSLDAFVDFAGSVAAVGFDEMVLHWPVPDSIFAADLGVFERILQEAPGQLG